MNTADKSAARRMVTGLFRDRASAERAYAATATLGYTRDEVNLVMSDATRQRHFADTDSELGSKAAEGAGVGAGIGGVVGAVLGAVAALGTTLVLPGLGLVVAGPVAAALAGAGTGGIAGGLVGALVGMGMPHERLKEYEEGVRQGGVVMAVVAHSDADAQRIETLWKANQGEHVLVGAASPAAISQVSSQATSTLPERPPYTSGAGSASAMGAAGGQPGMASTTTTGSMPGGMVGSGHVPQVDPTQEEQYWRANYMNAAFYSSDYTYDDYAPAYALGYRGRGRFAGRFAAFEQTLADEWDKVKGKSRLSWQQAKQAARAAWERVERSLGGKDESGI